MAIKLANMCYFILMIHPAKVFNTEEMQVYQYKWKKTCI